MEVVDTLSVVELAAGATEISYGREVADGKTGKLISATVASVVACKWEFCTYNFDSDGTLLTVWDVIFTIGLSGPTIYWKPPSKDYITRLATDAGAGFCVRVTNLDSIGDAADAHCSLYWLEE